MEDTQIDLAQPCRAQAGRFRQRIRSLALVSFAAVYLPEAGFAQDVDVPEGVVPEDIVVLLDGTKIEGRVVFETKDKLVVRKGSRDREIEHAKIKSVDSAARSLREALERWDKTESNDLRSILDQARFCKSRGLEGEAEVFAHLALAAAPSSEEAHLLCGHEKRGDGWIVRDGSKRIPYSKLADIRKDWGNGWRFRTTHYQLATNLDLTWACTLAIELELYYRAFYAWFGEDLALYEVVEPMATHVHADKASFPENSGRTAYFDWGCNLLVQLALDSQVLETLPHEATHQILHNTAVETKGGTGLIPPWLHEGLAEYLASCRQGPPGRPRYDDRAVFAGHFACHRDSKNPYDLPRLLTFGSGDFSASSKADLKYAQAYTLVHFCLNGAEGAHRPGFMDFVRGAYRGKSSSSDFKSSLEVKEREFEKAWNAYVEHGR